jgi:WD40 repeat protein
VCDGVSSALRDATFSESHPTLVYACTSSGLLLCVDISTSKTMWQLEIPVKTPSGLADDPADFGLYAIAVNALDDLLAVSVVHEICFLDIRGAEPRLIGKYEHCHTGAVTQLMFHPVVPHHLLSGSDDGLVCVFDTSVRGEDDAIVVVLNAESSVSQFGVFGEDGAFVWIISRTDTISMWNIGSAERVADFSMLRMQFMEAGLEISSLVQCHFDDESSRLSALATTDAGEVYLFDVTPASVQLLQKLEGGHRAAVRTAAWIQVGNTEAHSTGTVILTGAEDSTLAQWTDVRAHALLPAHTTAAAGKQVSSGSGGVTHRATSWRQAHKHVRSRVGMTTGLRSDAEAFGIRDLSAGAAAVVRAVDAETSAVAPKKSFPSQLSAAKSRVDAFF